MTFHGFPNLFFTGIGQAGVSANQASLYDDQATHIAYIINETMSRGKSTVQPTRAAVDEWVTTIRSMNGQIKAFLMDCTPGYYNGEGKFYRDGVGFAGDQYGKGINAFNKLIAEWRANGKLEGMEFS
jgi:cyclohexanone monooxygenase